MRGSTLPIMVVVWLQARLAAATCGGGHAPVAGYFNRFLFNTRFSNNISAARAEHMLRGSARSQRLRAAASAPLRRDVILNNPYHVMDHILETSQQVRSSGEDQLRRHYNYIKLTGEAVELERRTNTFQEVAVTMSLPSTAPEPPAGRPAEDAYLVPLLDIVTGRRSASELFAAPGDLTDSIATTTATTTGIERDFADLKNFQKRKTAKQDLTIPLILPLQPPH
ncbi:uncharacterized protein LOC111360985 [Spodoptera litura]|uniref:Uncharacterized protein LOC111360985 n=1 Tax=Spodoptera litura TaxID=69820 RepID=A0A9J7J1V4_SPOLT|nr:uncharacterized protein LOC111360985 [Spodoptera litura]